MLPTACWSSSHARPCSRRGWLTCVLVVCATLTACFPKSAPDGTLIVANNAEVHSLDPQIASGAPEGRVLSALFVGLTALDPESLEVIPELAESFSSPDGGRSWNFHLRADLRWSDGSPLTAIDVVESWQRLLEPSTGAPYREWLLDLKEDGLSASGLDLKVVFNHAKPWFAGMCSWYALAPVPPGLRAGTEDAGQVSSGPFMLDYHRIRDRVRVIPNPHYHGAASVDLPAIDFLVVESQFTALNLFLSGDAHFLPDVPAIAVPALLAREQARITSANSTAASKRREFSPEPFLATYFYRFNTTKPPFDDQRVRRALSLAIDRKQLAATLGAGQPAAFSLVPPALPGYTPPSVPSFEPALARELLAAAGYGPDHPLPLVELHFNSAELHRDVAEVLQAQWRQHLGIKSRLYNQEWKVFLDTQRRLDYQLSRSSWIGDFLDPTTFLDIFHSASANNRTGWNDPDYDRLLERIADCESTSERTVLCQQAETLLLEAAPLLPLFHYSSRELVSERIKGFHRNLLGRIDWAALSLEGEE